jgi:hypothetical protein
MPLRSDNRSAIILKAMSDDMLRISLVPASVDGSEPGLSGPSEMAREVPVRSQNRGGLVVAERHDGRVEDDSP